MNAILSDARVAELKALGCRIEHPLSEGNGIRCRVVMPMRSLSTTECQKIFSLIIDGLERRGCTLDLSREPYQCACAGT